MASRRSRPLFQQLKKKSIICGSKREHRSYSSFTRFHVKRAILEPQEGQFPRGKSSCDDAGHMQLWRREETMLQEPRTLIVIKFDLEETNIEPSSKEGRSSEQGACCDVTVIVTG